MSSLDALFKRDYTANRALLVAGSQGEGVNAGDEPDASFIYVFKHK